MTTKAKHVTPSRGICILTNSKGEAWLKTKGIKVEIMAFRYQRTEQASVFEGRVPAAGHKIPVPERRPPGRQPVLRALQGAAGGHRPGRRKMEPSTLPSGGLLCSSYLPGQRTHIFAQ